MEIKGEWKTYVGTSDAQELVNSYKGHNVPWCSSNLKTAIENLEDSEYHIYYTPDKTGIATVPRLLVRMGNEGEILDVRGVGYKQNIDETLAPFTGYILFARYRETAQDFQKKATDMNYITALVKKQKNNEPLSIADLTVLHEIYTELEGFGLEKDPRIKMLRDGRNIKEDFALIFGKTFPQDLQLYWLTSLEEGMLPIEKIYGDLQLNGLTSLKRGDLSIEIHGDFHLSKVASIEKDALRDVEVDGDIFLANLTSVEDLTLPESFDGTIFLNNSFDENSPQIIELRKKYPNLNLDFSCQASTEEDL